MLLLNKQYRLALPSLHYQSHVNKIENMLMLKKIYLDLLKNLSKKCSCQIDKFKIV